MDPMFRRIQTFLLIVLTLSGSACRLSSRKAGRAPGREEAIVVYLAGEVRISHQGRWEPVMIGELLREGSTLQTGSGALCDIQIGDRALVRMGENTLLELSSLHDRDNGTRAEMELSAGTVLCKVEKLLSRETFLVRTPSTVAGVRGTLFQVDTPSDSSTTVAVENGEVLVKPRLDLETLQARAPDLETRKFLTGLNEQFPVLTGGGEIRVNIDAVNQARNAFRSLSEILQDSRPNDTEYQTKLAESGARLTGFGQIRTLSEQKRSRLRTFGEIPLRDFKAGPNELPVPVTLQGDPDTEILVNGKLAGRGTIALLEKPGTRIIAEAFKPGFRSDKEEITVSRSGSSIHTFEMRPIPDKRFTLTTDPPEAEIWIGTAKAGTGTYSGTLSSGRSETVRITAAGFNTRLVEIPLDEKDNEQITVILEKTVVSRTRATGSRIIGLTATDNGLILGDYSGALIKTDSRGTPVWTIRTANTPIEASSPAVWGNTVVFSGLSELILADKESGKVRHRRRLPPSEQHIFGRHAIPGETVIIHPSNDGMLLLDPANGDVLRTIAIPDGTRMTPLLFNGRIYLVNQEGILYVFDEKGTSLGEIRTSTTKPMALSISVGGSRGYYADRNGRVVALDLTANRVLWTRDINREAPVPVSDDLAVEGEILVAWSRGALYAIRAETGQPLWSTEERYSAPPLIHHGKIYVGTESGELAILDGTTGTVLQLTPLGERITVRPVEKGDRIWAGTNRGGLLEIRPLNGNLD